MKFKIAEIKNIESIKNIVNLTINKVYIKYYPKAIVEFFINHHSPKNIEKDIKQGFVYLIEDQGAYIGTITLAHNEITRLFILPKYQGKGYGRKAMDFAEESLFNKYEKIELDASLPAKNMYVKRGYTVENYNFLETPNGDVLYYEQMKKSQSGFYNNKRFKALSNSETGQVNSETIFNYYQEYQKFWGTYEGGEISKGFIVGIVLKDNSLKFSYQHLDIKDEIRMGQCESKPVILSDGKIKLFEKWQWLNGDKSHGESELMEID